jgi:hypothetical protein
MKASIRRLVLGLSIAAAAAALASGGLIAALWLQRTDYYAFSPHPSPRSGPPHATWTQRLSSDPEIPTVEPVESSPAVDDHGTVYVVTGGGTMSGTWRGHAVNNFSTAMLTALDRDGRKVWEIMPGNDREWDGDANYPFISTSPIVADDGTIFIVWVNGDVMALNPDGTAKWEHRLRPASMPTSTGWVHAPPAIASDGTSYWPGKVVTALGPDGALPWQFIPSEQNFYAVSIARDGTIYARTARLLYAIRPDRTELWHVALPGGLPCQDCTPALDAEGNIHVTAGGRLVVIAPNGRVRWAKEGGYNGTPLIGADGTIYVACGAALVALGSDGALKWRFETWHEGQNVPAALGEDGTVYVKGTRLRALSADGALEWQITASSGVPNPWFTPVDPNAYVWAAALGGNGRLYTGTQQGLLSSYSLAHGLAHAPWPMPSHDARHTARQ